MKKSQRLRLTELKKKDAAALSADEKSELQRLEALALANPDASKDEDDTKLSVSQFIDRMTGAYARNAALAEENNTLKARIAQLEAAPANAAAGNPALVAATAQLASVGTFLGIDLAGKKPEELTSALNARVDVRAGEKLAELGFPSSGIPSNTKEQAGAPTADLLVQYAKIADPSAAGRFYAQNITPLLAPKSN